jgi:hypothetical protein
MKIKNILLGALLGAGLAATTASAQQVYSQNVVGYATVNLTNGYTMVANPLSVTDQTATNDTVLAVFGTNLPINTTVFKWNGTGWDPSTYSVQGKTAGSPTNWTHPEYTVNAGEGLFIQVQQDAKFTFAGNVMQGTNIMNLITNPVGGYAVASSYYPIGGDMVSNLNFVPSINTTIFKWDTISNGWTPYTYSIQGKAANSPTNWSAAGVPQLQVGEGFMIEATNAVNWTNNLIIQ